MAVKIRKCWYELAYHDEEGVLFEYLCDTESDVADLPNGEGITDWRTKPRAGSSALVAETGNKYKLNSEGTWDEVVVTTYKTAGPASVVSFSDAVDAPVADLTAAIVPVQDLNGYDAPWAPGAGKNKFDVSVIPDSISSEYGVYEDGSGGIIVKPSTSSAGVAAYDVQNTRYYTLKDLAPNLVVGETYCLYFESTGTSKQIYLSIPAQVWKTNESRIITQDDLDSIVYFYASGGGTQATVTKFQIESGSTATSYAPYSNICPISGWTECKVYRSGADTSDPTIYTVSFGVAGTVYGGTLDVTTGTLTVTHYSIDLGTRNWSYNSGSGYAGFTTTITGDSSVYYAKKEWVGLCSSYQYVGKYNVVQDMQCGYIFNNGVYIKDSRYGTDTATFKTAMSGVQLVYEIATPIVYHLTPVEIRTLAGQNTILADTGDTTVTYKAKSNSNSNKRRIKKWL